MPLVSLKFSDHCHFLHFSAELLALGENIARNICRLIVDCARHWHGFSDMIFIIMLQLIARFHIRIRKKASVLKRREKKVC